MPAFLGLFSFLMKQEGSRVAETNKDFVCDGEVCRPLERSSSVKPNSQPARLNSVKLKRVEPVTENNCDEKGKKLSAQLTVRRATETLKPVCAIPSIICRILGFLGLKKLNSRCSLPTAR